MMELSIAKFLTSVWGNAETLEACRENLQDDLERWIILELRLGHTLSRLDVIEGI